MTWSYRFARVAGIDLKVHVTFFLVLVLGALQWSHFGVVGMGFGVLLMLLLFLCVVLHELGHSLVAKRYGAAAKEIVLLPIGGVAVLGRIPTRPLHELLIAIAGPLVNVVIAVVLVAVMATFPHSSQLSPRMLIEGRIPPSPRLMLVLLLNMNVMLVLFNMIPAFPLDGGRVLRSILAMFMEHGRATRIASMLGQIIAMVMGFWALTHGNLLLAVVAVFIFMGAGAETAEGVARTVLSTFRVGDAYNKYALTLSDDDRVSRVVDYLLTSYQPDFAVLRRGSFLGVVSRADVLAYLSQQRYDVYVTEILHEEVLRVAPAMTLEEVRELMSEKQARLAAVFNGERFMGLVSAEDIAEAFTILSFVRRQGTDAGPRVMPHISPAPGYPAS